MRQPNVPQAPVVNSKNAEGNARGFDGYCELPRRLAAEGALHVGFARRSAREEPVTRDARALTRDSEPRGGAAEGSSGPPLSSAAVGALQVGFFLRASRSSNPLGAGASDEEEDAWPSSCAL